MSYGFLSDLLYGGATENPGLQGPTRRKKSGGKSQKTNKYALQVPKVDMNRPLFLFSCRLGRRIFDFKGKRT